MTHGRRLGDQRCLDPLCRICTPGTTGDTLYGNERDAPRAELAARTENRTYRPGPGHSRSGKRVSLAWHIRQARKGHDDGKLAGKKELKGPPEERKGAASSGVCPRAGWIILAAPDHTVGGYPTNCKTWRCLSCRNRVLSLLRDRIEYGASLIHTPLWFITVTFATGSLLRRDAKSVEKAFRAWCALLRKPYPNLKWFKVVEWTKRGQAHLHLIVGGLDERRNNCIARWDKRTRGKRLLQECHAVWNQRVCREHQISYLWRNATKDSYIVHSTPVAGPRGIAAYMGKYITKEMPKWRARASAGFRRRWSSSASWPTYEPMRLRGSKNKKKPSEWSYYRWGLQGGRIAIEAQNMKPIEEGNHSAYFDQMGDDRTTLMQEAKTIRRGIALAKRMINASTHAQGQLDRMRPRR